jgi:hypothetical protein
MTQNRVVISVVLLAIAYCPLLKKKQGKKGEKKKKKTMKKTCSRWPNQVGLGQ